VSDQLGKLKSKAMLPNGMQPGYSIRQAADLIGKDRHTLRRWIDLGEVKVTRLPGGRLVISKEELESLIRKVCGYQN